MSASLVTIRFRCDLCATEADLPGAHAADITYAPGSRNRPAGWSRMGLMGIRATDVYGSLIEHLCPACSVLSISEFARRVVQQSSSKRR